MASLKRKTLYRVLQISALGVAGLDLLVYLAVARPLAIGVDDQHDSFLAARQDVAMKHAKVAQLQKELTELPQTNKEMNQFLADHVPERRRGYSRAAGLVNKLTQDSGVQLDQVAYRLDDNPKLPLEKLGISVKVEGPFESLQNFTHALETSDDLLTVRGVILQPGDNGSLALRLLAELYVSR